MITPNFDTALLSVIPALINLGIIVYIIFFLPKGKTTQIFTFLVLALFLWQVEDSISRLTTSVEVARYWDKVLCIGWLALGPLGIHFCLRFASLKILHKRLTVFFIYFPYLFFYAAYIAESKITTFQYSDTWGWVKDLREDTLDSINRYFIAAPVLIGIFILFRYAYKVRQNKAKKIQTLLIAFGMLFPAIQGIITQIIFPIILKIPEIPLTSTFLTFMSVGIIISLSKYKLFDVSESVEVDTILENLTNIVFIISPEMKTMFVNPHCARVFNIKTQQLFAFEIEKIFLSEAKYHEFREKVFQNALKGESVSNFHTSLVTSEGEQMEVLVSANLIKNNNVVQGILLVVNDITERLATLKELELSNERYQYVTQATFDAVWDWDLTTNSIYWGKGFEKLFGHNVSDLNSNSVFWADNIHPDDKKRVLDGIYGVIEGVEIHWNDEYRFKKQDGHYAYVHDKGIVIRDKQGAAIRMIGAMQDITKDKEHIREVIRIKQNLDSLISNTTDLIWSIDTNYKIITSNKSYNQFIQALSGKTVEEGDDVFVPQFGEEINNKWRRFYKRALSGETFSIEESTENPLTSEQMYSIVSLTPIRIKGGKVTGIACYAKDVTSLKRSEQKQQELNIALEKRAEELSLSNSELEKFAYVASHDLQEPLRMVSSFLQLLEKKYKDKIDANADTYIQFAINGANQMKKLILDLLEYSRVGTTDEGKTDVNMNEVMDNVIRILKNRIEELNGTVEVDPLPVLFDTSKTQMHQLMQNLVGNALKYHSDDPPKIKISVTEEAHNWIFSVSDNGIGIDTIFKEKIFIIFQRLHNKSKHSGTGIGLSICKKIIDRNGGNIWVESNPGQGSTFYFSLPKNTSKINKAQYERNTNIVG